MIHKKGFMDPKLCDDLLGFMYKGDALTHYQAMPHFDALKTYTVAVENMVRKGEIACNKQFLLFSPCFLPFMALIFHFKHTLKCYLQFVPTSTSLNFVVW